MIHLLGLFITTMSIAGLGIIIEGATGAWSWLSAWVRTRPRLTAEPSRVTGDTDDEENQCN